MAKNFFKAVETQISKYKVIPNLSDLKFRPITARQLYPTKQTQKTNRHLITTFPKPNKMVY